MIAFLQFLYGYSTAKLLLLPVLVLLLDKIQVCHERSAFVILTDICKSSCQSVSTTTTTKLIPNIDCGISRRERVDKSHSARAAQFIW